jgi:hypothetical protein
MCGLDDLFGPGRVLIYNEFRRVRIREHLVRAHDATADLNCRPRLVQTARDLERCILTAVSGIWAIGNIPAHRVDSATEETQRIVRLRAAFVLAYLDRSSSSHSGVGQADGGRKRGAAGNERSNGGDVNELHGVEVESYL